MNSLKKIFLEDKALQVLHNLKQPYSFTTEKGIFNDRFVLRYVDKNAIDEATASWPSGHSSMSFAGMTVIILMLRTMFNIKNIFSILGMMTFGPYIVSSWIATSRVLDNKHHEDDIMAGALIGIVCTLLSFHTLNMVLLKCDMKELPTNYDIYHHVEAGNTNSNSRDGAVFSRYHDQYTQPFNQA